MEPTVPVVYTGQKEAKRCSQKTLIQMTGKTRKFSKGHSNGFIPNYRHAVETMAESEGFGSSGRVDTEMTLSEDSSQPQRKYTSSNVDIYGHFSVPKQVLPLSTMSKSERKDLELRLKRELDQVRILQRRVASLAANVVVLSPVSDIRSCSDGQKRPPLEQSVQGKKRGALIRNDPPVKSGIPRQPQPLKQGIPGSTSNIFFWKQCDNLVSQMMSHKYGWVFNEPVDVVKLGIPDYLVVIKHPMDLGTIKGKIVSGEYSSPLDFAADVRLTFSNATTYNPPGTEVHLMAKTLSKFFEQRWKSMEKKIRSSASVQPVSSKMDAKIGNKKPDKVPPSKRKNDMPSSNMVRPDPVKRTVTAEEKIRLSKDLEDLLGELPERITDFLKENSSAAGQISEDEIEIEIDALSDETLFKLRQLLDDYLLEKKKNQTRAEPCEMELYNESGFSNSSMQPCKVDDAVDEDIDIGTQDPPVSSFPLIEIERDTTHKINNSISSSSESGSSSDSDSSSSSGGESDGTKALPLAKRLKTTGAEANLDKHHINPEAVGRNQSLNGSSQKTERKPLTKSLSVVLDGDKEGESAPSGRQVSPDKLYRAALLRSRFADTILKAQEKTLEKGEKRDPEKLRLEREELERRQREEKARLQAEARAAEEARRKAEALAAAEAKRKRELEREAARLALQKMEKTVDINENSEFLGDLELLSSAPPDDISTFTFLDHGSSKDCDNSLLGSFKLRGNSNPLEQLGLYMKVDDEEEEEIEAPKSAPTPLDDVEEGEIDP
ncbi:hypothetical protein Dimus_023719 [Dionaea muscipula]